jgi:hypothetical protein
VLNHIDVSSVLRQTLACDLYSNLVTRSTGAAVRGQIEALLNATTERALTVIDFSQVSMIDFSCADEVVAKLLMRYVSDDPPRDAYFLFRGVTEDHSEAIEAVLLRHDLAAAVEDEGHVRLMGVLSDNERRCWEAAYELGRADATEIALRLEDSIAIVQEALAALCRRRLMMQADGQYVVVGNLRG